MSLLCACAILACLSSKPARADEKGGLRVDVQKKVLNRSDKNTVNGVGSVEVDRTLTLKVDITNNAMRDMPETKAEYIALIQRWGSETGNIERYEGNAKVDALLKSRSESVLLGEFHIGGHLHGSSEMHVDHLIAWKVVIEVDGKKVEFASTATFDAMNKKAKPGSTAK